MLQIWDEIAQGKLHTVEASNNCPLTTASTCFWIVVDRNWFCHGCKRGGKHCMYLCTCGPNFRDSEILGGSRRDVRSLQLRFALVISNRMLGPGLRPHIALYWTARGTRLRLNYKVQGTPRLLSSRLSICQLRSHR